ncbi:hypothetical protein ACHQM5_001690 [Ranunculus cassubicifolius]
MAVSPTSATIFVPHTRESILFNSSQTEKLRFPLKQRSTFVIYSSSDAPAQETSTDVESSDAVEASNLPYSLISALNIEKAMRGIAITDEDYYGRLGIERGCPYSLVPIAYKSKCEEVINQGLEDEEELKKQLELLKEAYMILSSEEERRFYDWSLTRSQLADEKYVWPFETDITQGMSPEDPPPQEPEDVGPTRLVGYFMVGWLVLGIVLSIALNR